MPLPPYAHRGDQPKPPAPVLVEKTCRLCGAKTWQHEGVCMDCQSMLRTARASMASDR